MKTKHYLFILLAALALATGCYNDDKLWKAVREQQQRIEALEAWQKTANSNIEALQALVSGKHFITDVTPVVLAGDTTGYTIAFHDRTPVTVYNGEKGEQGPAGLIPAISLTQGEDGNWYWTLNGTLMKDAAGQPIPASGPAPELNTGQALTDAGVSGTWTPDAIYLSVDAGKTWTQVSGTDGKDGDAVFAPDGVAVDKQAGYVTFTLADKFTTFRLPLYGATVIRFESNETLMVDLTDGARAFLLLPNGFPKSDYGALMAEVVAPSDDNSAIVTRGTSNNWKVKLEPPVFHDNGNIDDPYVEITPPQDIDLVGTKALLRVTLVHSDGHESTATRVIEITNTFFYAYTIEEQLTEPGIQPALQDPDQPNSATNPYLIKNAEHLQWIKRNPTEYYYYKLMKDIEVTGSDSRGNWVPIGGLGNIFYGYFDGNGKKVYGKLVAPADVSYFGFFGYCRPIGIRDLHFTGTMDLSKATRFQSAGAIAGDMGYGTIKHCSNSADLTCKENVIVGGIAGSLGAPRGKIGIEACLNTGNIVSGKMAGGIAGNSGSSLVVGCINKGNMETTGFDYAYAGGITGKAGDHVMACWSKATSITHQNNGPAGGITGFVASGGKVETCCWKDIPGVTGIGEISSLASDPTGGLLEPFSGDRPTAEEITKMNEAWRAQNPGREYQFNATTGEIEAKP